jgi:predicted ferric reductase
MKTQYSENLSKIREETHMRKSFRVSDFINFVVILALVVTGIWLRHGALEGFAISKEAGWQSIAQLFGLYAQLAAIFAILLASRARYLERVIGLDNMLVWHRWVGEAAAIFLLFHIMAEFVALELILGPLDTFLSLTGEESYMALATIGSVGILVVTLSSLRFIRRRFNYETWYYIHLLIYVSIFLGFFHQIYLGFDFAADSVARMFWIILNISAVVIAIASRWGGLIISLLNPYTISEIEKIGLNSTEITVTGKNNKGLPGQFAIIRSLTRNYWWQPHPFSLSDIDGLGKMKFTIRSLGKGSEGITKLKVGSKIAIEGPYGAITRELLGERKILMIAGGVGIAPVRSLLGSLSKINEPIVIYRSNDINDSPHIAELSLISEKLNGKLLPIVGSRDTIGYDPFSPEGLKTLVPDISSREIVLCGPEMLIDKTVISLVRLKVPMENIHHERLWW